MRYEIGDLGFEIGSSEIEHCFLGVENRQVAEQGPKLQPPQAFGENYTVNRQDVKKPQRRLCQYFFP
jgi:hypothetical protein